MLKTMKNIFKVEKSLLIYLFILAIVNKCSCLQVHTLDSQQAFNCCPRHYFRTDPVIYCYKGREKNVIHIWETVQLHINLASDEFELFEGHTPVEVQAKFEARKSSWYFNIYSSKKKVIRMNPFNSTCVGVVTMNDYAVKLTRLRVDYWRVLMMVAGIVLFFLAPKLSSNSVFYYLCGVSFGTCASLLILVYILSRLLPKKPLMYGFLASGWAVGLYLAQFLWDNMRTVAMEYQSYILYYVVASSTISFMVCYRLGPVTHPRSINLITWIMQGTALLLILFSSNFQEATFAFNLLLLAVYIIPFGTLFRIFKKWTRWFGGRPRKRFLSEDEYYQQGVEETKRALEDLRGYCSSPECNQWRTVLKLHDPLRFAKFMEGSSHLDDDEVLSFELEDSKRNNDLLTDDSSDDDY